jgi:hypothetical protein
MMLFRLAGISSKGIMGGAGGGGIVDGGGGGAAPDGDERDGG